MSQAVNSLGEALRAWRDRLSPVAVGLPGTRRRRTPGLRREELASLAGISVDYLLRLEQGRARHPSRDIVASLARALQLSKDETCHLHLVAGLLPPSPDAFRGRWALGPEQAGDPVVACGVSVDSMGLPGVAPVTHRYFRAHRTDPSGGPGSG